MGNGESHVFALEINAQNRGLVLIAMRDQEN
jgi:hypothetical protein